MRQLRVFIRLCACVCYNLAYAWKPARKLFVNLKLNRLGRAELHNAHIIISNMRRRSVRSEAARPHVADRKV